LKTWFVKTLPDALTLYYTIHID